MAISLLKKIMICTYCKKVCISERGFWTHLRSCKNKPDILPKSPNVLKRMKKGQHVWTDEERLIHSEKRKKYLRENPEKHPWKSKSKQISLPCENVKKYLREKNIEFVDELQPLKDRGFRIDIAFPHIKVGVEINGNQHYEVDGTLKPYYKERHKLIETEGWKLHEIHFSQCFHSEAIARFLNFEIPFDCQEIAKQYKEKKYKIKEVKSEKRGLKVKMRCDDMYKEKKNEIFNHGIDFSKFGWVKKVAEVMQREPGTVNRWMKRHHLEWYTNHCFKKKVVADVVITEAPGVKRLKSNDDFWKGKKDIVLTQGVDFTKPGWHTKVAKVLGMHRSNVSRWMSRHHPEFYEKECFKK